MADIIQAAKWMQEGKSVRRASWPTQERAVYTGMSPTQIMLVSTDARMFTGPLASSHYCARLDSILADDWEIEESGRQLAPPVAERPSHD